MDTAIIGLVGIVVGALLGGTGKYFTQRRDAWLRARASGLVLLAEVRSVGDAVSEGRRGTPIEVAGWEKHGETLAAFRRGNYPSGLKASGWSELAHAFAELEKLDAKLDPDWRAKACQELAAAEALLRDFDADPAVFWSVIRSGVLGRDYRTARLPSARSLAVLLGLASVLLALQSIGLAHAQDERGWVPVALYAGLALALTTFVLVTAAAVWRSTAVLRERPPDVSSG